MKYREKGTHFINAFQFGVDPNEITIKKGVEALPPQMSSMTCNECGNSISIHGVVGNNLICPGTFIVHSHGRVINIIKSIDFYNSYIKMEYEEANEINDKNNNNTNEESKEDKE